MDENFLEEEINDQVLEDPATKSSEVVAQEHEVLTTLSETAKLKLEAIEDLMAPCDRATYGEKLRKWAKKLGKSVRTVQRLVKDWEKRGLLAVTDDARDNKGTFRKAKYCDPKTGEEKEFDWATFVVDTYRKGNEGSSKMSRSQVVIRAQAQAKNLGIEPISHMTVHRILKAHKASVNDKQKILRTGWRGSRIVLRTRDGKELEIEHTNDVWQEDHTRADEFVKDPRGTPRRPWFTKVTDTYSGCIMGIRLGFEAPSAQVTALALRHAILPKKYDSTYKLYEEWGTHGVPRHLFTDGGKDFRSNHLKQIAVHLGFLTHLRAYPSEGGVEERGFKKINEEFFSTLPGYCGPNVKDRTKDPEKDALFTLEELERLLVAYIVNRYNQDPYPKAPDQTRFQRWQGGLPIEPRLVLERELDICLLRQARRSVYNGGYIKLSTWTYWSPNLAERAGDFVAVRYDPGDIRTILVYEQAKDPGKEVFITTAELQDVPTDSRVSITTAKTSSYQKQQARKSHDNSAALKNVQDQDEAVAEKRRQQRRRKAQPDSKPAEAEVEVDSLEDEEDKVAQLCPAIVKPTKPPVDRKTTASKESQANSDASNDPPQDEDDGLTVVEPEPTLPRPRIWDDDDF
jgi:putative transposase